MKIITTTLYTLFTLLLIAVVGLFLASILPIPGHIEIKIVKSGSMEPAIHTGSIVVVQPGGADYAIGDIITFGEDTKVQIPTTHRIVSIRTDASGTFYTTKGDANNSADPGETAKSAVIGHVIFTVPYAGYILNFARQPIGFTLMIAVPAGVIILDELLRIFREIALLRQKKKMPQV
jgi:signal peptidase